MDNEEYTIDQEMLDTCTWALKAVKNISTYIHENSDKIPTNVANDIMLIIAGIDEEK